MPYVNTVIEGLGFKDRDSSLVGDDPKPYQEFEILGKVLILLIASGAGWGLIGAFIWLDLKPFYYSLGTQIMLCLSGLSVGAVFGLLLAVLFDIVILGRLDN